MRTANGNVPGHARARRAAFGCAAVLLGLSPFFITEVALRLLDWGRPSYHADPFMGFSAVNPLFVLNDAGGRYEIPPSRQAFFCPDSFSATKAPRAFRIFCLGGSTVQGRPFAIQTSFSTWLELNLQAADKSRTWEVVNCGGISYASYRLVPILQEVLGHQADMIILYTGHNEFLEDRTYGHIKNMAAPLARALEFASQLRTYTLLREGYLRLTGTAPELTTKAKPVLGPEVDAILDYRHGLRLYRRDEKGRRDTIQHFRYNVWRMVQLASDAGVPLILVNPVSNLRNTPPFKAEHREDLTPEEFRRLEDLRQEATRLDGADRERTLQLLREAIAIDDRHAGVFYDLGRCYDNLKRYPEARRAYVRAKDLDICALRILEPMHAAIHQIGRLTNTSVVDVRKRLAALSTGGIPGNAWLLDHVHPTIRGHQEIAEALLEELIRLGVVTPTSEGLRTRDGMYRKHLASLGNFYYAEGEVRLRNLWYWTQGQARGRQAQREAASGGPPRTKERRTAP